MPAGKAREPERPDASYDEVLLPEGLISLRSRDAVIGFLSSRKPVEASGILNMARKEVALIVAGILGQAGITGILVDEAAGSVIVRYVARESVAREVCDEELEICLDGLRGDFDRGIVLIDGTSNIENYRAAVKANPSAGKNWQELEGRLLANGSALLKKAANMQRGGELIGVFPDGNLCIIDRKDKNGDREPVIYRWIRTEEGGQCDLRAVTADAPDRTKVYEDSTDYVLPTYREIRDAVMRDGFELPAKGIVAAVEAVSGYFVASEGRSDDRDVILDCGDGDVELPMIVGFNAEENSTDIFPGEIYLNDTGVVRVLKG